MTLLQPTFIEMFAGVGGVREALRRSGWICVWANDNDRSACKIYHHRFGYKELVEADIQTVDANTIPDHTLLTAGFPCQAFSVAGKRKGFRDTRGTLFHEICRVAKAKRPPLLLLENVKGLLSHDEGLTFQIIIESLEKLGYLVEWQVLNSKHFGVPQNRERVFIVGHLRGERTKQIFPIGQDGKEAIRQPNGTNKTGQEVAWALWGRDYKDGTNFVYWKNSKEQWVTENRKESLALKGQSELCRQPLLIHNVYGGFDEDVRVFEDYSPTIRTPKGGGHLPVVVEPQKEPYIQNVPHGYNEGWQKTFPNLRAKGDSAHNELLVQNSRIRRLTPTECERLQGFPDDWTRGVSDTQRYKLLGNAITVNVVEYLGQKLLECLKA